MSRCSHFFLSAFLLLPALFGRSSANAEVRLFSPSGYLPGVPFLIRVEVQDDSGARDWQLWDAEAQLTTDQAGVTLSTNRIQLRNGLGTALLTITGDKNFTLKARVGQEEASRTISNRSSLPVNSISGTLTGAGSGWGGVVRITGNVIVPAGHTLTIQANTIVLVDGVDSGTSGITIRVNGAIRSLGSENSPVTITCSEANKNWGQIRHESSQPSLYRHTFISKAGRIAGEGHTGSGPAIKSNNSTLEFENSVISDLNTQDGTNIGKIMMATGSALTFRNCVLARARMGPEISSTGLLLTNSYIMQMSGPDDADGIYLHSEGARTLMLTGCVLAGGTDDAIDTADSNATVENCIIRDWPNSNEDAKGVSVFHGQLTMRRCLIANCFIGLSAKSSGPLSTVRLDHCTIIGIEKGISAATKSNATAGNINITLSNSIVRAPDALHSDFGPEKFISVTYNNLSETWPGTGNITADPLFLNPAAGDFRLQSNSPAVNAADPAFPADPDGSRSDMGFYAIPGPANPAPSVTLSNPLNDITVGAPGSIILTAEATDLNGTVAKVEFFANGARLGEDSSSPYTFAWNAIPEGIYTVNARATDDTGLTGNSKEVKLTVSSDTAAPTIASQSPAPGKATNLTQITVNFSKPVVGVDAADLRVNGVAAISVTGSGSTYVFTLGPLPPTTVDVTWFPGHGIQDVFTPPAQFDATRPGASWQYQVVDSLAPVVQTISPAQDSTVPALTQITIQFSEAVSGVNASDLHINSVPASSVTGSAQGPYTFSFARPSPGPVTVAWASAHGIADLGGNAFAGGSWSYLFDPTQSSIVINEIMYHPSSENPLEEFIELHNYGTGSLNLKDWRFNSGVDFIFPDIDIAAGGYLVVAANTAAFKAKYPGVANVVGDWSGRLSNSRESITLENAQGVEVDSVSYADEGDWATRKRGDMDRQHRGWTWFAEHDGLGRSVELINPKFLNHSGQNWAASAVDQGTPGKANSRLSNNIAPLVENVSHFPVVPKSSDPVVVMAKITDETDTTIPVTLRYRADNLVPASFLTLPMLDNGQNGDASPGDGIYSAIIPAQANNTVIEFFVTAVDASEKSRTWPAPAIPATDGTGPFGQVANALYQVDDSVVAGTRPIYKFVLREEERQELQDIGNNVGGAAFSDAQMNMTFISIDGNGTGLRYLASVRNRGHGSRSANPNNHRVNFRSDEPWKNVLGLNLNSQYTWLQSLGATLNLKSGAVGAYSTLVQLRVNNADLSFTGAADRTYGLYAANEAITADWAERHFPDDEDGNIYRAIRDINPSNFDYRTLDVFPGLYGPENRNSYTNTWFKESNVSEDDWTDLIAMLRVFGPNGTEPFNLENLNKVINVEQWLRHMAVMNLLGNGESGLNSGYNDDYFMYRGINDPRFILMYYDLDQIVGVGGSFGPNSSIYTAANNNGSGPAFERFLRDPAIEPLYHSILRELIETSFSQEEFDAVVDQVLTGVTPDSTRQQIKTWMNTRRASVLSQISPLATGKMPVAQVTGVPRSPTPAAEAFLTVAGENITHFRYRLNSGIFGEEIAVTSPIVLANLPNGTNKVDVVGRNAAGIYQPLTKPTTVTWVVDRSSPAVRLNEVIASRSGNLPDQIELFNESNTPINLAGLRLTDDRGKPNKFVFGSTTLAGGAYLALDEDQLGFALNSDGQAVYLFASAAQGGALLDSVEFGRQLRDFSIGRFGNSGEWLLTTPTFGAVNQAQALGDVKQININEWLALGASPYPDDFIELHNSSALPANVGGLFLSDHPVGAPRRSPIAPLTFIAPHGYLVFTQGNGNQNDEFDFNISADQGEIALLAPDNSIIDTVVYGPQIRGVSSGRCPDGSPSQKGLESPTPGAPNLCPVEPPPPLMVTLLDFNHLWRYENSGTDLGTEWKDLNFNDATWLAGSTLIGFDDDALAQPVLTPFPNPGFPTYYFRTKFSANLAGEAATIQITHLIDDGAAFYLNGKELRRYNLADDAVYDSYALSNNGDAIYRTFTFDPDLLISGQNEFAVEVHQINAGSSDMVFGMKMEAIIITNTPSLAGIVINEVFSRNESFPEADGANPDWIELYNPSDSSVDLAGMSLTDAVANPRRWVLPNGTLLPAKGFLKIRFDANSPQSSTNTGFGLASNGAGVYLYSATEDGGALLSSVTYGLQPADWSIGRVPDGNGKWVLTQPTLGRPNTPASLGNPLLLKVNEWMADPATGEDWFEIFNPSPEPVDLSGLALSDALNSPTKYIIPPLSFIGNGLYAYQRFEADDVVTAGADHVNFKLSNNGESLAISTGAGVLINGVSFGAQSRGVSEGRLLDGGPDIKKFPNSPSPGSPNYLPSQKIAINELLSHSDDPLEDAVELHNPTSEMVDISGWYLSDSALDLRQYQIPTGTKIPPGGYLVIYENQFNNEVSRFSFSSSDGDDVFLSETSNGVLNGYRAAASFGPAENGVSFGRYRTSQGDHFVPMSRRTFGKDTPQTLAEFRSGAGLANALPKVGPIVISEVMYHPKGSEALEFIELHNIATQPVTLSHPDHPSNTWRLRRGVEFDFPLNTTIPAGGFLVLVGFDPATDIQERTAFETVYGKNLPLFGPFAGKLNDAADAIELLKPDAPQTTGPDLGKIPYVSVDRLDYSDSSPWHSSADGDGDSLQRLNQTAYGNDPVNWTAASPNPGASSSQSSDSDNDGMPNDWETANGLDPDDNLDAARDEDGDGLSNLEEYQGGFNPRQSADPLRFQSIFIDSQDIAMRYWIAAGQSHTVLYSDNSPLGPWRKLIDLPAEPETKFRILKVGSKSPTSRFYKLVTPAIP